MFFQGAKNRQAGPSFSAGAAQGALSKGPLVSVFGSTRGINAASQRVAVAGGAAIDTSAAGVSFVSGVQGPLFAPYGIPSTITEVTIVARVVLPTATFTELPLLYLGGAYDSSGNQFKTYIYHYGGDLYFSGPGILDVVVSSAPTGAFDIAVSASLGPTNGVVVYVNGVQVRTGTGSSITPAVTPVYACIASRPEQNATIPSGAAVGYAHAFMRALPADEIRRIHENPTGVLRKWAARTNSAAGGTAATIAGTQSGAGAQAGAITTAIQAAGIQIGLGATSGALSTTITLAGTVTGVGTQAGAILTRIELGGAVLGAGLQALSLATGISVAGIVAGEGAASGGISLAITLGGQQLADSLVTAGIVTAIEIAGQQIGAGTSTGSLGGTAAQIGGTQSGAGVTSLALSTTIQLTGQQIADAIMAGSLTTEIRIGAVQNGVGVIVGSIGTASTVSGSVVGQGGASGQIVVGLAFAWDVTARRIVVPSSAHRRLAVPPATSRTYIVPS